MLEGSLKDRHVPNLLAHLRSAQRTGTLSITYDKIIKRIYIRKGIPAAARSSLESERLGEFLVSRGAISVAQRDLVLDTQQKCEIGFATALKKVGALNTEELYMQSRRHFLTILYSLFGLRQGDYCFEAHPLPKDTLYYDIPDPGFLLYGMRQIWDIETLNDMIGDLSQVPLQTERFHELKNFRYTEHEHAVIKQIDSKRTIREIGDLSGADPNISLKTILFLWLNEWITLERIFHGEEIEAVANIQSLDDASHQALEHELVMQEAGEGLDVSASFPKKEPALSKAIDEAFASAFIDPIPIIMGETHDGSDVESEETETEAGADTNPNAMDVLLKDVQPLEGQDEVVENVIPDQVTVQQNEKLEEESLIMNLSAEREAVSQDELLLDPEKGEQDSPELYFMDVLLKDVPQLEGQDEIVENVIPDQAPEQQNDKLEEESLIMNLSAEREAASQDELLLDPEKGEQDSPELYFKDILLKDVPPLEGQDEVVENVIPDQAPEQQNDKLEEESLILNLSAEREAESQDELFLDPEIREQGSLEPLADVEKTPLKTGVVYAHKKYLTRDEMVKPRIRKSRFAFVGLSVLAMIIGVLAVNLWKTYERNVRVDPVTASLKLGSEMKEGDKAMDLSISSKTSSPVDPALPVENMEELPSAVIGQESDQRKGLKDIGEPEKNGRQIAEIELQQNAIPAYEEPIEQRELVKVLGIQHFIEDESVRVVINLDGPIDFKTYRLPEQKMIYVSLRNTKVSSAFTRKPMRVSDANLKAVRMGQFELNVARLVLDFEEITDVSAFTLTNPHRLVLNVARN